MQFFWLRRRRRRQMSSSRYGWCRRELWWFWWWVEMVIVTIFFMISTTTITTTKTNSIVVDAYDFDWYCPQYQQSVSQTKRNLICPTPPKKDRVGGVGSNGSSGSGNSSGGGGSSGNNNKRSAGGSNTKNRNRKDDDNSSSSTVVTSQVIQWNGSGPGLILQQPIEFYRSNEAKRIAETIMAYQHSNGGWHKHYDRIHDYTTQELRQTQIKFQSKESPTIQYTQQQNNYKTTIDNGVTTTEIQFLAMVAYEHRQKYGSNNNRNNNNNGNSNFNSFTQQKLQLRYQKSITRGIDFLLKSQYTNNGGWPQIYPPPKTTNTDGSSYPKHITFNDKAMINVLNLLHDIIVENQNFQALQRQQQQDQLHRYDNDNDNGDKKDDGDDNNKSDKDKGDKEELKMLYPFLSSCYHHYIEEAVEKGIQTLLDTQIVIGGPPDTTRSSTSILKDDKVKLGGWCQQHNLITLEPVQGRTFEPPSISGGVESLTIIQFLMKLQNPTPRIIQSIEHAIQWYDSSIIQNIQYECYYDTNAKRNDKRVVSYSNSRIRRYNDGNNDGNVGAGDDEDDSTTPLPLWARFYDMYDGKTPIFQDRDGTIYLDQDQLSYERRFGYTWYSDAPNTLFCNDYPIWKKKIQALQQKQELQLQPILDDTNDRNNNSPFDDSPINKKHQSQLAKNPQGCPPLPNNDSTLYATEEDYVSIYATSSAPASSLSSLFVTNLVLVGGILFVVWTGTTTTAFFL